jgi:hypothetical protein
MPGGERKITMGALLLILPVLALDVWLLATTGKKQFRIWTQARAWPRLAGAAGLGVALGIFCLSVKYKWGSEMRVIGFPVPVCFFHLENGNWVDFLPPAAMQYPGCAANFLSGLAAPLLPFKAAEFLRSVKAEL